MQGKRKYFIRLFAITGRKTAKLWHTGPLLDFFQQPFPCKDEDGWLTLLNLLIQLISVEMFTAFFKDALRLPLRKGSLPVCTKSPHMQIRAQPEAALAHLRHRVPVHPWWLKTQSLKGRSPENQLGAWWCANKGVLFSHRCWDKPLNKEPTCLLWLPMHLLSTDVFPTSHTAPTSKKTSFLLSFLC